MSAGKINRIFAALLALGGVMGVAIAWWMASLLSAKAPHLVLPTIAFSALFAWAVFVGVRLWIGAADGFIWARRLYVAQIPIVSVPGVSWQWFTGLQLGPTVTIDGVDSGLGLAFNVGANGQLQLLSMPDSWVLGLNLVAVAACLLLSAPAPDFDLDSYQSLDRERELAGEAGHR